MLSMYFEGDTPVVFLKLLEKSYIFVYPSDSAISEIFKSLFSISFAFLILKLFTYSIGGTPVFVLCVVKCHAIRVEKRPILAVFKVRN